MLSIDIRHPDSLEFITKKQDLTKVTGANVSVKVCDNFMKAVLAKEDYILRFPVELKDETVAKGIADSGINVEILEYNVLKEIGDKQFIKKIKADELWNTLMKCAWGSAEPGIIFIDAMHDSPDGVYDEFKMVCTNPCGEIPMGPYDSCRLIHKNLASYVVNKFTKNAHIDEELLYKHSYEAVRLADDLIDLELEAIQAIIDKVSQEGSGDEIELWTKIKETTISGRRAGLGFTGLADVIAMMGLRYDSDEGIALVDKLMKIQFKAELDCQVDLAIERGRFPGYNLKLESNNPWIIAMSKEFPEEIARMNKYSRRNLSWSTVAPTGTASLMSQTSAGVEPVFLPFYNRKRKCMSETDRVDFVDKVGEKYTLFPVVHKGLKDWAKIALNIKDDVVDSWTLETWEKQWKKSPYYKSTSPEINWRQRVLMQSTIQKYITHSISSTVNLAEETTQQEIQDLYVEAWKHGLKGITIYRDKCRDGILTKVEKPTILENRRAPKRPVDLEAECHVIRSGGEQFIILVGLFDGKPYEVFAFKPIIELKLAKHKGIITKVSKMHYRFESEVLKLDNLGSISNSVEEEAATLYSSMLLRHGVPIEYITKTAKKVNSNITSFSSAMCRVLSSYIGKKEVKGEVCPECGGTLVRDNGCIHCLDCGYSKCL